MSFETSEIKDRCKLLTKQGKNPKEIAEQVGPPTTVADIYNLRSEMRRSGELPPLDREEKRRESQHDGERRPRLAWKFDRGTRTFEKAA